MQLVPRKLPQRQTVSTSPRDTTLRVNALKVPHKDHAEVDAWWNARATGIFVKGLAQRLCKVIELPVAEHTIEGIIQHMPDRLRQLRRRHPHLLLPFRSTQGSEPLQLNLEKPVDELINTHRKARRMFAGLQ